ncbi:YlmH/Sll1252 family protein [Bacillus sp. JCM 19041]|uniref:YlmH/Sll1252 family protein n=1 Tax=Bacillus sp. JCM 19041 TaxID=1460637 RepID=UPI000ACE0239
MNTGLKREKFGDISVNDDSFSFACTKEAETFVRMSLEQVGKASVAFEQVETLNLENEQWHEIQSLVSSMRLDSVIAALYGLSRSKAAEAIEKGIVKVNWRSVDNTAFRVNVGDYLSVRGSGRGKVLSQEGVTKKDKIRLLLGRKQ